MVNFGKSFLREVTRIEVIRILLCTHIESPAVKPYGLLCSAVPFDRR